MKSEPEKDLLTNEIEQQRADILALQKRIQKLKPRTSHPEKVLNSTDGKLFPDRADSDEVSGRL